MTSKNRSFVLWGVIVAILAANLLYAVSGAGVAGIEDRVKAISYFTAISFQVGAALYTALWLVPYFRRMEMKTDEALQRSREMGKLLTDLGNKIDPIIADVKDVAGRIREMVSKDVTPTMDKVTKFIAGTNLEEVLSELKGAGQAIVGIRDRFSSPVEPPKPGELASLRERKAKS